ncbi:hypothetical protein Pryu01_01843 [Paraliobacillus ryukyuensis]|uniref:Phosphoribosylanthranilate isomerase n=1 Tax=Paraliobacillus ryukyuensis TaxID=200904 RepID=A0A366DSX4_9BACI|nr:phosphoribosylanthranilate isomerase [Paraliobacillus ryukyuensis]RBO93191.1 hypothetical protein DES48_11357 [Paraliobacillus ryukyuensis]
MKNHKFDTFINIAKELNQLSITPLLMGSVGLEVVTGKNWDAKDLDIHVPGDPRGWEMPPEQNIYQWERIVAIMQGMHFQLIDLHEHEFSEKELSVEFGIIDTLPRFAGVELTDLNLQQTGEATYYLLTPEQYLRVYQASSKDSYRSDNNNSKDLKKIAFLRQLLTRLS